MKNRLIDLAIQIQQIPSPTFDEAKRAQFVYDKFQSESNTLVDIQQDAAGNVLARLPGKERVPALIISAHLDTVFPAETDLASREEAGKIYGPGIGDNSLGVAGLFEILWTLREKGHTPTGDIWFVANTCEEGLGNLHGMKAVVERFGNDPKAYLVLEGTAFGYIYHKAIGVQRYKITTKTKGGHSWKDFGKPSAIHVLSDLIARIYAIKPPTQPYTTLNVGRVCGGTSINTIAAEAWLELDLRSEDNDALNKLASQVFHLVESSRHTGVEVEIVQIGQRPSGEISPEDPIIHLAKSCLFQQGYEPVLISGSTDANIPLSKGCPSLVLGLTHGGGAHTIHEYIETSYLDAGLEHILQFINRLWNETSN